MTEEVYRRAASILLFRHTQERGWEILLLHKPRKNDAWQLPQGGVEQGETTEQAALRELQEEASITGCEVLGKSSQVYQYDFPESYRKFRPDNVKGQRIEFIFARVQGDVPVRVDAKEVDGYIWLPLGDIGQYIQRKEYLDLIEKMMGEAKQLLKSGQ